MLKPEFAKKKSLRLKFVKVGIGHPPAQTPMSMQLSVQQKFTILEDSLKNENDLNNDDNPQNGDM